jgi:3',5'-cyclic AMP phosphodiesterase CpdA
MSRRGFCRRTGAAAAAWLLAGPAQAQKRALDPVGMAPSTRYPDTSAVVRVSQPDRIRLLQFTDLHFFCGRDQHGVGRDERTVTDLKRLIERFEPAALLITGDLWHDNPEGRGAAYFEYSLRQLEGLGVPWLFTWGNHDLLDDYRAAHDALRTARHSLYRGGPHGGNYTVDLVDGAERRLWELICLNTTNIGVQRPQREWLDVRLEERVRSGQAAPPAFCLLHIPVLQYDYIWVEEMAAGLKREAVCSWGENGSGLWHLQRWGTVKALFCGHDHVNDYAGSVDGIELVYGRATGWAGYGGEEVRKGAKLITINAPARTYTWETVFPDGARWRPEPGFRTEQVVEDYWMRPRQEAGGTP